ncbi:hypothetical protein SMD44_p10173 (plasmid) [Streptomyces alboflavus]|uniref:CRISPR-associated protein Cas5 n=1 Tax=Streptomyces alboflavus TaxID=67267 RepID=A0A291W548_9ACTN|nr:type I-E CRISPR-associated protein Cas5/CasD [Streptomyces alboflavus]ATM24672.1 hypothetical protein SMD44_p10173 [Streptomyces alboflavus]
MSVLVLVLAGPLQSWGTVARHTLRDTRPHPTKSGVTGMIAAALGTARTDTTRLRELAACSFAVRTDQPGTRIKDFHTTHTRDGKSLPLSDRYYLSDAVFTAALAGPGPLIETMYTALQFPHYALSLGRRACPPSRPPQFAVEHDSHDPAAVLETVPWQAAAWFQEAHPAHRMTIHHDTAATDPAARIHHDHPLDFTPGARRHGPRAVASRTLPPATPGPPDFFDALDTLNDPDGLL